VAAESIDDPADNTGCEDLGEGPVQRLVETTVDALAPDATDDVIAFAIHIPAVT
jgi:hypothetical protein